jgi:hypothetical protein
MRPPHGKGKYEGGAGMVLRMLYQGGRGGPINANE